MTSEAKKLFAPLSGKSRKLHKTRVCLTATCVIRKRLEVLHKSQWLILPDAPSTVFWSQTFLSRGEVPSCVCLLSHASFLACGSFPVCHQAAERWMPGTCAVQFSGLWSCYSSEDAAGGTLSLLLSITVWLGEDNLWEEPIAVSLVTSRMLEKKKNFAIKQRDLLGQGIWVWLWNCRQKLFVRPFPIPSKLIPSLCDLRARTRTRIAPPRRGRCSVTLIQLVYLLLFLLGLLFGL